MSSVNRQTPENDSKPIENKFLVPYEENPYFLGRNQLLEDLKAKLSETTSKRYKHRVALYGMGGVGKTQCAIGYVYCNQDLYERIYWITATDRSSMLSGYRNIAKAARLSYSPDAKDDEVADTVLIWLRQKSKWLIVIDNLDDIEVAKGLLPVNGAERHTLITTRNPNTTGIPAEPLEVPLLGLEDAVDLCTSLSGIVVVADSPEYQKAHEIIKTIDCLPLAIEQAASYIRETGIDFAEYLVQYQRSQKQLHAWVPDGNRPYPRSVATAWSMSVSLLSDTPSKMLRLFSLLRPDGILIPFLQAGGDVLDAGLQTAVMEDIEFAKCLLEMEKTSLIKWNRPKKLIIIHRLVQGVVKDEMSNYDLQFFLTMMIQICDRAFPPAWHNKSRDVCRMYVDQVMGPLIDSDRSETAVETNMMDRVGWFLRDDGKLGDSERLLERSLRKRRRILGAEHPDTLSSMNNLASTYRAQGRMEEALALEEEELEKSRRILGAEHPDTLSSMNNLALTYRAQGRMEEALALQEEALEKSRRILGAEHPGTLTSMNNLALTYRAQGRMEEALALQEEALEKRRRILGAEHPDTLTSMNNLASTYRAQGRMEEALALEEEALEKRRRILGAEHPDTLTSMNNLALTYRAQGRMEEALALQEEALEKRRRILGAEHPDTLTSMNNLALTYRAQGRMEEALALEEEALEKSRRILGAEHPGTLTSMNNLALTYRAQGRMEEALALQEEALEKRRRILGAEHPDTLTSMNNLASTYRAQGRMEEALALQEEALEKRRRILGAEHPGTLTSMNNLASTYWAQGRMEEALALEEEALEKRRRILGAEHPGTLTSMNNLASTYRAQGRMEEALALQEEALEKRRRILGAEHPDTLTSMNNLASTYRAQGRMEEALALEEEALEKRRRILGAEHPDTLTSMDNLASTYRAQGRMEEALALQEEALEKSRRILGAEHPDTLTSMNNLASHLSGTGQDGGGAGFAGGGAGEEKADPWSGASRHADVGGQPRIYVSGTGQDGGGAGFAGGGAGEEQADPRGGITSVFCSSFKPSSPPTAIDFDVFIYSIFGMFENESRNILRFRLHNRIWNYSPKRHWVENVFVIIKPRILCNFGYA